MSSQSNLASQISSALTASKSLTPTPTWLQTFLQSQKPTTPLPALTQTALFRLLASDITTTLLPSPQTCFPSNVHNAGIKERRLDGPVVVQVLSVEDMSKSRWEQIEAIEALERGEGTKGREIIRVAAPEDGTDDPVASGLAKGGGPHKLLLQDARGERVYGIELKSVEGGGLGMSIGSKMVLRGVTVARAVVLLEPRTTVLLGGKIEGLHKQWRDGRKEELRKAIEASEREGRGG